MALSVKCTAAMAHLSCMPHLHLIDIYGAAKGTAHLALEAARAVAGVRAHRLVLRGPRLDAVRRGAEPGGVGVRGRGQRVAGEAGLREPGDARDADAVPGGRRSPEPAGPRRALEGPRRALGPLRMHGMAYRGACEETRGAGVNPLDPQSLAPRDARLAARAAVRARPARALVDVGLAVVTAPARLAAGFGRIVRNFRRRVTEHLRGSGRKRTSGRAKVQRDRSPTWQVQA
jgi:hypothetical protein